MVSDIKQLVFGGTIAKLLDTDSEQEIIEKVLRVTPSKTQINWQALEFVAFIHFGVNTYTNREWGDGSESPNIFNPVAFDAEEWVQTIQAAEMKAVILTCKHHDGFCLWPSKYTEHSVKHSQWQNGQGDIVRDLSIACRKHGLKFGIYLSPWDRHDQRYGDSEAYNAYYKLQLTELLTEYGEVFDIWLDGACAEGPNGKKQVYDWRGFFEVARKLQPQATITGMGPDVRWCGNEAGTCRLNEWSPVPIPDLVAEEAHLSEESALAFPKHNYSLAMTEDLGSRSTLKAHAKANEWVGWYPAQVDTSIRPGWFYHPHEDHMVKSLKHLVDIYYQSVGGNAQLLLNLPPTPEGRIHEVDTLRLKQLGEVIRKTFEKNLAEDAQITTYQLEDVQIILLTFEKPILFNTLMLQEDLLQGQRVEKFEVEIDRLGNNVWVDQGTVIGYKKLVRLQEQEWLEADQVRIKITGYRAEPVIKKIGLFKAPILVSEPEIQRDEKGWVKITTPLEAEIYYTLDGTVPTSNALKYTRPFEWIEGGLVKAIAIYPNQQEDFYVQEGLVASKQFGVSKREWQILSTSGGELIGFEKEHVLEEGQKTYLKTTQIPYEITLDMGQCHQLIGWSLQPVSEGYDFNYNAQKYSFLVSKDGEEWECLKYEEGFNNIYHNPILQEVYFSQSAQGRYIRLQISGGMQQDYLVIQEISVIVK